MRRPIPRSARDDARSTMPAIARVGVLGCGLMGSGIAQVAATAGFPTIVRDVGDAVLAKGRSAISRSLDKLVEKAKLEGQARDGALGRLSFTTDLAALEACDLVIEAVTEDLDLKNTLWRELDALCPPSTIFASNTSSLTIGEMASATARADRFVGLHFFNPVPLMPLVEVVRAVTTSGETFDAALEFVGSIGKEPVVSKDRSGFIVNLLLVPYLLDAIRALERGVGSIADIDRGMQLGCGHPMGPFTLLDFVGLDTTARIAEIMFDEYREPRYAPPPLLRRMVTAGLHGRKTGRGFYDYATDPPQPSDPGF
jgi:3-hydroxybutyryl-CoA dehydrogenase